MKNKFIQIACVNEALYALDEEGLVWQYNPYDKTKDRFAFWGKITNHRAKDD